jgi:hypothetical protein
MLKYRKRIGRYEPWHFFPDCPDWPRYEYIELDEIPLEELCHKCVDASAESDPESSRSLSHRSEEAAPSTTRLVFRKESGADTWHLDPACLMWPKKDYLERTELPRPGELCNECKARLVPGN